MRALMRVMGLIISGHLASASVAHANGGSFSNADLVGRWAGAGTGTYNGQPFGFVGAFQFDGQGNATIELDTTFGPATADCDYSVQSNGLAQAVCSDSNNATTFIHIVIGNSRKEFFFWEWAGPGTQYIFFASGTVKKN
jgi:hypothetical protein